MNRLKDRLVTFYLFIYLNTNPKIERKLLNAKKKSIIVINVNLYALIICFLFNPTTWILS
jgi:hypothetical protein